VLRKTAYNHNHVLIGKQFYESYIENEPNSVRFVLCYITATDKSCLNENTFELSYNAITGTE